MHEFHYEKTPEDLFDPILPYVSIDLETLGLNPDAPIIQAAAVVEYSQKVAVEDLPSFEYNIALWGKLDNCEAYAIHMNKNIISDIVENGGVRAKELLVALRAAFDFASRKTGELRDRLSIDAESEDLDESSKRSAFYMLSEMPRKSKVMLAGKNIQKSDLIWLKRFFYREGFGNEWDELVEKYVWHRVLDPGPMFFPKIGIIPSLNGCKSLLGISGEVKHEALEDARDVIRVVRALSKNT